MRTVVAGGITLPEGLAIALVVLFAALTTRWLLGEYRVLNRTNLWSATLRFGLTRSEVERSWGPPEARFNSRAGFVGFLRRHGLRHLIVREGTSGVPEVEAAPLKTLSAREAAALWSRGILRGNAYRMDFWGGQWDIMLFDASGRLQVDVWATMKAIRIYDSPRARSTRMAVCGVAGLL
jgi:hypothetical protein